MNKHIVKQEHVGKTWVSTVKLPKAYKFDKKYPLGKYETMILDEGEWLDYQERCDTLREAKIQHQKALLYVMEESK